VKRVWWQYTVWWPRSCHWVICNGPAGPLWPIEQLNYTCHHRYTKRFANILLYILQGVQTFGLITLLTKVSAWRFFIHFMRLQRDLKFLSAIVASLAHRLIVQQQQKSVYKWLLCITDPSELGEPFDAWPVEPLPALCDRGGVSRGSVLTGSQTRSLPITI